MSKTKGRAEVETNQQLSYCQGRNGEATVTKITAWETDSLGVCYIEGISSKGRIINGGFGIDTGAMDQLAVQWLASRNGIHPDNIRKAIKRLIEESVDAVVG